MRPLESSVHAVNNLDSLRALLREELGWPLPDEAALEDVTFDWTAAELRVQEAHAARLHGGVVRQLRPFTPSQPWGVFLVEFADDHVYRTALRQVLRGLVPHRRRDPTRPAWQHENLIPDGDWYLLGVLNSAPLEWYFREISVTIRGGYLRFIRQYVETFPIPDAPTAEREVVAKLAQEA